MRSSMKKSKDIEVVRLTSLEEYKQKECIVFEIPLTIILNGKELVTLQCTPEKLEYLAVGFLLSEGIVKQGTNIKNISLNERGWYVQVELHEELPADHDSSFKRVIGSGCAGGVSFYRSIDAKDCTPLDSQIRFPRDKVFSLMKEFQQDSTLYQDTHGVHSCGLFSQTGVVSFADDIGRHNAVDKILGECFLKKIPVQDKVILTTGRISSEILIKVAKQQIPIIISRSAPTDLAVSLADKLRITLIGFVRGKRMNVYTYRDRII